jgi:hypothetical protein
MKASFLLYKKRCRLVGRLCHATKSLEANIMLAPIKNNGAGEKIDSNVFSIA